MRKQRKNVVHTAVVPFLLHHVHLNLTTDDEKLKIYFVNKLFFQENVRSHD